MMELKTIAQISHEVWQLFVKYSPKDADLDTFADDIHELDTKYKDTEGYKFMQELTKAYFNELNRRKVNEQKQKPCD